MAEDDTKPRVKKLKDKLEEKRHPTPSEADKQVSRALTVLVALLESGDEKIRLEAAKAILGHHPAVTAGAATEGAVKKVVKKVTKLG